MLNVEKIPFTEDVILFERTVGALNVAPTWVASRFGLECDDGHDDLDAFQIIILGLRGAKIGFLRHKGAPDDFSGVCNFSGLDNAELRSLLEELFSNDGVEFIEYAEPW